MSTHIHRLPLLLLCTVLTFASCTSPQNASVRALPASLPPLPEAVASFGAVTRDGWLYVCGGHRGERHAYNSEDVSGSFHRLKLSGTATWESLPATEPAQGAPLIESKGRIYRVGGMAAANRKGEPQQLFSKSLVSRFDPGTRRWESLPPMPVGRSSHDIAIVNETLYVGGGWHLAGGSQQATWHDTLLSLDLRDPKARWHSVAQPFKRRGLTAAALGGTIYFLGGMDSSNKPISEVDAFDTRTGEWTKGPELPAGPMKGFGSSAVVHNDRLYWSGMKGDLRRLSTSGGTWELVGRLQHPRFFHRLVTAGSRQLVAAGGEDAEGKRNDLEVLTPSIAPLDGEHHAAAVPAGSGNTR